MYCITLNDFFPLEEKYFRPTHITNTMQVLKGLNLLFSEKCTFSHVVTRNSSAFDNILKDSNDTETEKNLMLNQRHKIWCFKFVDIFVLHEIRWGNPYEELLNDLQLTGSVHNESNFESV